jgi:AAA lid domain
LVDGHKIQPLFSNARSIRNALDRMRLRQANRLVADLDRVLTAEDIMLLGASAVGSPALAAAAIASMSSAFNREKPLASHENVLPDGARHSVVRRVSSEATGRDGFNRPGFASRPAF